MIAIFRASELDTVDSATVAASTMTSSDIKATSPIKSSSQRRPKIKKNASTCTSTSEVGTITTQSGGGAGNGNGNSALSVVEIESDPKKSTAGTCTSPTLGAPTSPEAMQDKLQIVNERKYSRSQAGSGGDGSAGTDDDVDSENEKLSPLLSPGSKSKNMSSKSLKQVVACLDADDGEKGGAGDGLVEETTSKKGSSLKRNKPRPELSGGGGGGSSNEPGAEDSDYYTPEDTQNSILSPLCPAERAKSGDPLGAGLTTTGLGSGRSVAVVGGSTGTGGTGVVVGFSSAMKKNLHKKSTSVGNMLGSGSGSVATVVDLKSNNVSSLPGELLFH